MLEAIFTLVQSILGSSGTSPEAQGIVAQVFEFILGIFGA